MRTWLPLLCLCAYSLSPIVGAERHGIGRRQDQIAAPTTNNADQKTTLETSATRVSNEPSPSPTSEKESERPTTDKDGQEAAKTTSDREESSAKVSVSTTPSGSSTGDAAAASATTIEGEEDARNQDTLPLDPKITPALGLAGAFLILIGFTYALVGIKNKWIQIFLSTSMLAGLSVTVLIIYVMNPPVRLAVQGAYLVAIVLTGIIFGAGSLVFKEVTEGLGCLLGGFCLSMWFLALKPGGLLPNTVGKVILIAVFTIVAYAFSFTHYTRPYALIGATSFAGATAVVIGVDCFARAGLKEFWLYIWNLNDKLFPLDTNTYPHTRGIRVELAIIPLICFIGIVSQMKLWRVIQDRRDKRDAIQLEEDKARDVMEGDIGRRLEEGNERDRAMWEAEYGDGDELKAGIHTDSGLGTEAEDSLRKPSVSVRETSDAVVPADIIELKDMRSSVGPASASLEPGSAMAGQSSGGTLHAQRPLSESLSASGAPDRLSANSAVGFTLPLASHSRGSSVVATLDGELDGDKRINGALPSGRSSFVGDQSRSIISTDAGPLTNGNGSSTANLLGELVLEPLPEPEAFDAEEFQRSSVDIPKTLVTRTASSVIRDKERAAAAQKLSEGAPPSRVDDNEGTLSRVGDNNKSKVSLSAVSNRESLTKGALEQVPSRISHVVLSYRTNEWAKHLSHAAEPQFDEPEAMPEGLEEEAPAHLAEPTVPKPFHPRSMSSSPLPEQPSFQTGPLTINRSSPYPEQQRSFSDSSLNLSLANRGLRHSSNSALGQTLVTSPIDENAEANFSPHPGVTISPSPNASSTLLSVRDSHIRTKQSQLMAINSPYLHPGQSNSRLSLIDGPGSRLSSRLSLTEDALSSSPALRSASRLSLPSHASFSEEDMPLSQRRTLIQQNSLLPETRLSPANDFDAHLPKTSSTAIPADKRMSMLANWKQSMHQEVALNTLPNEHVEVRRAEMLMEKKHSKMSQQHSEANKVYLDHAFDQAMRRGDMQRLHKAAMKKMQAGVNKNVN